MPNTTRTTPAASSSLRVTRFMIETTRWGARPGGMNPPARPGSLGSPAFRRRRNGPHRRREFLDDQRPAHFALRVGAEQPDEEVPFVIQKSRVADRQRTRTP